METIKVGIADDNVDFRNCIAKAIKESYDMRLSFEAENGDEAVEYLKENDIDILLLDLVMPHRDGIAVLEDMNMMDLSHYPKVIVVSAVSQNSVLEKTAELGASYFMKKPVNPEILLRRIRQVLCRYNYSAGDKLNLKVSDIYNINIIDNDLEYDITKLLCDLGIASHTKGFIFLREAISFATNDIDVLQAVTKELYPLIAVKHKSTPIRVERDIRHAIEIAWIKGNNGEGDIYKHFDMLSRETKPTTAEFISLAADKMRLERRLP